MPRLTWLQEKLILLVAVVWLGGSFLAGDIDAWRQKRAWDRGLHGKRRKG